MSPAATFLQQMCECLDELLSAINTDQTMPPQLRDASMKIAAKVTQMREQLQPGEQSQSDAGKKAIATLSAICDRLDVKSRRLTMIDLPEFVDAELFESHLRHCYEKHRSTNKETQRAKLEQLAHAYRQGLDVYTVQAQAVGGGWLNFYVPNMPPIKKSKLEPYAQEILAMREKGISEQRIVDFLETERGLKITRQNLNYFIKKYKERHFANVGAPQ